LDESVELHDIEEMHYLMVRVEKMKKTLLHRIEAKQDCINLVDEQDDRLHNDETFI
jgi:hypothetical protein